MVLLVTIVGVSAAMGTRDVKLKEALENKYRFYAVSPLVFPSPEMPAKGEWAVAANESRAMIDQMDESDLVDLTVGIDPPNGCHGYIDEIDSIYGFHGMCFADSGNGLRGTDFVSSFPSGIHAGASWNRDLTRHRASAIGKEFAKKGVNVLLGPVVGPLGRLPVGGRNWEGFSNDPYLAGALAYDTVQGVQDQGVIASVKHFIGNEQESYRRPSNGTEAVSSNIDDRPMHELYLWPFQDALRAGSGSVMCSYQRINNTYGCENSYVLNHLLKTELGFEGFVVSDWEAVVRHEEPQSASDYAFAGLDLVMPSDESWSEDLSSNRTDSNTERVKDMAQRILASWYRFNQRQDFLHPGHGMPKNLSEEHEIFDARDPEADAVLFKGAVEGHVLVKNANGFLPLSQFKPNLLSLFGYSATSPDVLSPTNGQIEVSYYAGQFPADAAPPDCIEKAWDSSIIAIGGTLIHGGGSGATSPFAFTSPYEAVRERASRDGTGLLYDFESSRPAVHSESDACIVFGNTWASEGYDRPAMQDDYTNELIQHVADRCEKTIVVFHNAGVRLVDTFVDHPNVTAIVFAHLPGEKTGDVLAALLYGDENFSGKLPYSVPRNAGDYGDLLSPARTGSKLKGFDVHPQSFFSEGLHIDYRFFDQKKIQPRYEFGFGMSYTSFELSDLNIEVLQPTWDVENVEWPVGEIVQGGREDLWDVVARISATIKNTGEVAGAEVAQLYLSIPNAPPRQLRGFSKHSLEPSESKKADFNLTRRDVSIWDVERQEWRFQAAEPFHFTIGTSRADSALEGTLAFTTAQDESTEEEKGLEGEPVQSDMREGLMSLATKVFGNMPLR